VGEEKSGMESNSLPFREICPVSVQRFRGRCCRSTTVHCAVGRCQSVAA